MSNPASGVEQVPPRVRRQLERYLIDVIELDEQLKLFWWSHRYRQDVLLASVETIHQAREFLRQFKEVAGENELNGTVILRTVLHELRVARPAVKVLDRQQVGKLLGG